MKKVIIALVGAFLIASCGQDAAAKEQPPKKHYPAVTTINGNQPSNFWHGTVDGRECIAIWNYGYGNYGWNGITCDWSAK